MRTWFVDDLSWTDQEWAFMCQRYYGEVLTGRYAHFCNDWDDLPIDETCPEFECCTCWGTRGEGNNDE